MESGSFEEKNNHLHDHTEISSGYSSANSHFFDRDFEDLQIKSPENDDD
jgi:hypothetical protein